MAASPQSDAKPIDTKAIAPPALSWRRPIWLWLPVGFALSVAWPALFLRSEGGVAQFAAITAGAAFIVATVALAIAYGVKRPPQQRRHVVAYMVIAAAFCALLSPVVFVGMIGFAAQAESGRDASGLEVAGLSPDMAWALAPLALAVGAPTSVIAGLALACLGFAKKPPPPPPPAHMRRLDNGVARRIDV